MAQRAGEKSWQAAISGGRWWFPKRGVAITVFWNGSMSNRDFFMTALYLEALVCVAFGHDGGCLDGAAADRQFRLGRYHLDPFRSAWSASEAPSFRCRRKHDPDPEGRARKTKDA
jgi:hypothetical protein